MSEKNAVPFTSRSVRKLKGIIPPKRTTPEALREAVENLRKFVKRYPGLGEEVMKEREQKL